MLKRLDLTCFPLPHEPQHTRPLCPSPTPDSSIESVMPSSHLILCHPLLPPSIFPRIGDFSNESVLHNRQPMYWSFSFSIRPSNEYSGLISFRMDCSPGDSQESSPTPQFKSFSSLALSFLYGPTLLSIHDFWKKMYL